MHCGDGDFWLSAWVTMRFTVETVVLTMLDRPGAPLMLNRPDVGRRLVRKLVFLLGVCRRSLLASCSHTCPGPNRAWHSIAYALGILDQWTL